MQITDKTQTLKKHPTKQYSKRPISAIKYIAIHHSATKEGSAEAFARYHVDHNSWPGIGYHYVINKDGSIDFTNEWNVKSAHVGNSNRVALGICLVGNFTEEDPAEAQLNAAAELCKMLIKKIPSIEIIQGHSDFPGYEWKRCPAFDVMEITNRMKGIE